MQANTLKLTVARKRKKQQIGRGGKKGTFSGKGMKGQKARSGVSIDPLFEGGRSSLIDRLKKVRGFKSFKPKAVAISLAQLESKFAAGAVINKEGLVLAGLVKTKDAKRRVKILGTAAEIKQKFTIGKDVLVSETSRKSIEKAGGMIESEKKPAKK